MRSPNSARVQAPGGYLEQLQPGSDGGIWRHSLLVVVGRALDRLIKQFYQGAEIKHTLRNDASISQLNNLK